MDHTIQARLLSSKKSPLTRKAYAEQGVKIWMSRAEKAVKM